MMVLIGAVRSPLYSQVQYLVHLHTASSDGHKVVSITSMLLQFPLASIYLLIDGRPVANSTRYLESAESENSAFVFIQPPQCTPADRVVMRRPRRAVSTWEWPVRSGTPLQLLGLQNGGRGMNAPH
jgi:hypothetical protein